MASASPEDLQAQSACDLTDDDPLGRCGYHHPTDQMNFLGAKNCCCGSVWLSAANRCGSGAVEGEADKTYLESLKVEWRSLRNDLDALKDPRDTEIR